LMQLRLLQKCYFLKSGKFEAIAQYSSAQK